MANPTEPVTAVTLRRGVCRGFCPAYEVTLRADGSAEWNGDRFVDPIGRFHGQLDIGDFEKLVCFIERTGFFEWDEEFSSGVSDAPDFELIVAAGKQTKHVRQNGIDDPPDFWVISAVVDGIARTVDWIEGSLAGECGQWTATLTTFGIVAPFLSVRGVCTFPTAGYSAELRRHRPQTGDPQTLLLDRVVTAPSGPVADVLTDLEVEYFERNAVSRVIILPDGVVIEVETIDRPPFIEPSPS